MVWGFTTTFTWNCAPKCPRVFDTLFQDLPWLGVFFSSRFGVHQVASFFWPLLFFQTDFRKTAGKPQRAIQATVVSILCCCSALLMILFFNFPLWSLCGGWETIPCLMNSCAMANIIPITLGMRLMVTFMSYSWPSSTRNHWRWISFTTLWQYLFCTHACKLRMYIFTVQIEDVHIHTHARTHMYACVCLCSDCSNQLPIIYSIYILRYVL